MVEEDVRDEINPNDPRAREIRERAVEYADRVSAGEEPWEDLEDSGADAGFEDIPEPVDEDVGESGESEDDAVVEVPQGDDEVFANPDEPTGGTPESSPEG